MEVEISLNDDTRICDECGEHVQVLVRIGGGLPGVDICGLCHAKALGMAVEAGFAASRTPRAQDR